MRKIINYDGTILWEESAITQKKENWFSKVLASTRNKLAELFATVFFLALILVVFCVAAQILPLLSIVQLPNFFQTSFAWLVKFIEFYGLG